MQVELNIWQSDNILNGVADYCLANAIPLLAYRALGGPQRRRRTLADPLLTDLATSHGVSPFEISLAWLLDLSELVVPLAGPGRIETVQSLLRATGIKLTDGDRARLEERFPAGRRLRAGATVSRHVAAQQKGEVVLIMGLPGAGKSTAAAALVAQGYERLNRDDAGGSLADLLPELDALIASGASRIVLDNTYGTRKSRARVIEAAARRGLPVRCLWLSTSLEDAQVNAVGRIVSRYGRLLEPDEGRAIAKQDVAAFAPAVLFRHQRELEPPAPAEGFAQIDVMPFERRRDVAFTNKAVILWCDGVLRRSRRGGRTPASADDVEVLAGRRETLRRYADDGWLVLGLSWQPEVAEKTMSVDEVRAGFERMRELLDVAIEVEYCPHAAGPPVCWCRKPLPGLGVLFIERHRLDPSRCIYVGAGPQDPGFARRLGFEFRTAGEFFAPDPPPAP